MEHLNNGFDTKVETVTNVELLLEKKNPPNLVIKATGQSASGKNSEGMLIPYEYILPPADGIFEFTFVEGGPDGYTTDNKPGTVTAEYRWDDLPDLVKGVKIYGETNDIVKMRDGSGNGGGGSSQGKCSDWEAIHDFMPPRKPTLRVTSTCEFPTGGYKVELRPHSPQGINPAIYLLDKIVTPPAGDVPQQVTNVDVKYTEETDFKYTQVQILPDGPVIDVQDVS